MRERHKQRFSEATAKLREQHKLLARRAKQLESQLTRNSVCVSVFGIFGEVLMREGCLLCVQEAMSALTNELQIRQGTIGELRTAMEDVSTPGLHFSFVLAPVECMLY